MNGQRLFLSSVFLLLSLFVGCNESFDPRAPYQDRLVVYSVLSNDRNLQYVRLSTTYNPPHFNPEEITADPQVTGATIFLTQSGGPSLQFHDTLLVRPDTSRYNSQIHAYVAPLLPAYGAVYHLAVYAPGGSAATATMRLPDKAYLSYSGINVLQRPADNRKGSIYIYTTLSDLAGGFVVRMFLDYTITDGALTFQQTREVPAGYRTTVNNDGSAGSDLSQPIFPSLRRVQSEAITVTFGSLPYENTLTNIQKEYFGKSIKFEKAVFLVLQAEPNFFKYYSITNGFQDSVSIRLDQPLYTNISGGTGLFGGYAVDTLSYQYESNFIYNR